ncbi:MAG: hypothetical protein CVU50_08600 [Candidatus Cloacimonetes bacterium HGW-Cloacimonetes-3]|jgi:hypothetical protein|nr:MAG: hypothetical protein CVU50_08600 [Candidatus Cloacimonetes bacterium HGW-Cloacimonetes-3]
MNSKYMIFSVLTALIIVGIYQIFAVGRFNYPEFRLKAGQVSEAEVIAPFDFPVLKPEAELADDQEKALSKLRKPHNISDEIMFDALSALDAIFGVIAVNEGTNDPQQISSDLKKAGWNVNPEALDFASRVSIREKIYNKSRHLLTELYRQGIYDKAIGDSISIIKDDVLNVENSSLFLSLDNAISAFVDALPEAKAFAGEIAPQIVKPNLIVNADKYNEQSMKSLGSVPQSEGVVLQNEVIVRKNTRISPDEIRKLESLQEAYRNRNVRKSPFQELFLTVGLLMFIFMVVSLANHYFGVQSKSERILVADFLPLNLGFVLLVLFATINNYVLGYSNLLVPFAMMAICATILVSFEYGVLYSICSLLIISPFMNWETFTPIVLILSTLITLILIRRQNAYHEYTMIGLYLVVSTLLSIGSIAIYKSDSLVNTMRSLGFGLASSVLSIGGIILIVPYYERKWNRATKQTLLELLDFNHPLLKELATNAVGTYHHSLIVGNLSERAAEAIGANPLLARVGSYYHDVGKIVNTDIFTENNEDSAEIHNGLSYEESAGMIRNHVSEGILLAKKYRIPQPVIDIIMQHHGNSLIRYFYEKAKQENPDFDKLNFEYTGPRPQSKEAVLVMLADIVESTTKSKNSVSEADISKIIDDTIDRLINEGQLDEAPITIKDLHTAKESMLPVLESIYRKRLDYPDPKE